MKNANRIENKKTALKNALINNCPNGVGDISVSHLCELADISRASFYNYYEGIHSIVEELVQEHLMPFLKDTAPPGTSGASLHIKRMLEAPKVYLFLIANGNFKEWAYSVAVEKTIEEFNQNITGLSKDMVNIFSQFYVAGYMNILENFLKNRHRIAESEVLKVTALLENHIFDMVEEYKR